MVLYKRKPIILPDPEVLPLNLNINVWHIDETGEWFATYAEYLDRLDFYSKHHFTCEITGTSCLTFFEALDSEEKQFRLVEEKFPLKLREPVARFLHFNEVKRLDALVEKVYARFKNDYFPGETVYLRRGNKDASASSSSHATPAPELTGKDLANDPFQLQQHQKSYIIKEKAQFNATTNPTTGEVLVPAYSKYMLIDSTQGSKSLIADQSQLHRDRSSFTKHLIKCFCKITLRRASSKMGAPWAVKEEYLPMYGLTMDWPIDMLMYKDDDDKAKRSKNGEQLDEALDYERELPDFEETKDGGGDDSSTASKRRKVEDSKEGSAAQEVLPSNTITSILEDLSLPYQGPPHIFEGLFHYNQYLEQVPLNSHFRSFASVGRLLQTFQFLNSFGSTLLLSHFSLDQFITTFKCSDPYELKGEVVYVEASQDEVTQREPSLWGRNANIREMIQNLSTPNVRYTIAKSEPASDDELHNINANGTGLLVEIMCALLRLFINEEGEWSLSLADDWLLTENHEVSSQNGLEESNGSDEEDSSEVETPLEKCLNYRNVFWAERLTKRQFNNGYWLIILLGILQDCNHIPVYKEIISEFNQKVIPESISASQLPRQLWQNFCSQLSLQEKVNVMWVLVDLVTNFSPDIKAAVDSSMELCTHIRSERYRVGRDLKTETVEYHQMRVNLQALEGMEDKNEDMIEQQKTELSDQQTKIDNLQTDKLFLDKKLMENDIQRLKPLGVDRYGNKYYWLDMSGVPIDEYHELTDDGRMSDLNLSYHSGKLWIQGPSTDTAKFLLRLSGESFDKWHDLAHSKGKAEATKEVFHLYRKANGSYVHTEGDVENVILDHLDQTTTTSDLSPILKKVLDETPECLLLSDREWYCVDSFSDIRHLLDWFDTWGRREHELIRQLKSVMDDMKAAYDLREKLTCKNHHDDVERKLLAEFKEFEICESDWDSDDVSITADDNVADEALVKDEEELESIAEEIMKLDDCSQTRKILNKIKELEDRRDILLERRQMFNKNSGPGSRIQARSKKKRLKNVRDMKLARQSEILTELLNHRHIRDMENVTAWKNDLAIGAYGTSLRKNASGSTKDNIAGTVDKRLEEIILQTSKATATASAN